MDLKKYRLVMHPARIVVHPFHHHIMSFFFFLRFEKPEKSHNESYW